MRDGNFKSERLDHTNMSDQFRAEMEMQSSDASIGIGVNEEFQLLEMVQASSGERIALVHPKVMRHLAEALLVLASEWERGELKGLEVPK
jgi:hypothetical protein